MILTWNQTEPFLTANGEQFQCSCRVRNELNGLRQPSEIVYSMPDGVPYQPRVFPKGSWLIGRPEPRSDALLAPWFIPTNAYQDLPVWETKNGLYVKPTNRMIRDVGYGLHASSSLNTWGCCRIATVEQQNRLVALIFEAINRGETANLEVL